jgi:hypothetical protein
MWARLIEEWRRAGHLGLTPSMLVGALRTPPGSIASAPASFGDLRMLLESMRDERLADDRVVRIFECQNIVYPVATLSSDRAGHAIGVMCAQRVCSCGIGTNLSERSISTGCCRRCGATSACRSAPGRFSYSRKKKQFHEFDDDDLQLIKAASRDEDE